MSNEEYNSRRNHELELFRSSVSQERSRAEKLVYLTGAIPLTTITLAELQWYPATLMIVALGYSIISYGFWFVNEYHGSAWRIYDARANADLISPQALSEAETAKLVKQSKRECAAHSKKADETVRYLTGTLAASILLSLAALVDQYIDIEYFRTPSQGQAIVLLLMLLIPGAALLIKELYSMFKTGWPTSET